MFRLKIEHFTLKISVIEVTSVSDKENIFAYRCVQCKNSVRAEHFRGTNYDFNILKNGTSLRMVMITGTDIPTTKTKKKYICIHIHTLLIIQRNLSFLVLTSVLANYCLKFIEEEREKKVFTSTIQQINTFQVTFRHLKLFLYIRTLVERCTVHSISLNGTGYLLIRWWKKSYQRSKILLRFLCFFFHFTYCSRRWENKNHSAMLRERERKCQSNLYER